MKTSKFGPSSWKSIHFITYPYKNKKCKSDHLNIFMESLGYVLPCIYCRNSYKSFCQELPCENYLLDNNDIFYWTYCIHNKVNDKLRNQGNNVPNNPSFKSICKKYKKINPNIWHKFLTEMIYFISFNYSNRNYNDHNIREWYQKFFWSLSRILPSNKLRKILQKRMEIYPIQNYLKNGNDLFYWSYLITNNKKPFKDIKNYYSQFKATKCGENTHIIKYSRDTEFIPKEYTLLFDVFGRF